MLLIRNIRLIIYFSKLLFIFLPIICTDSNSVKVISANILKTLLVLRHFFWSCSAVCLKKYNYGTIRRQSRAYNWCGTGNR